MRRSQIKIQKYRFDSIDGRRQQHRRTRKHENGNDEDDDVDGERIMGIID